MLRKLLTLTFVLCCIAATAQHKKKKTDNAENAAIAYDQIGSPMPPMLLVTTDSVPKRVKYKTRNAKYLVSPYYTKMYTNDQFDNGANLLVMMFSPTCGHCEDVTDGLISKIDSFKKSKLILMSNNKVKMYLPGFARAHHVREHADVVTIGTDSTDFIKNTFLFQTLPQINIYDGDRKLIKIYTGVVPIDTLMQYVQ